MEKSQKVSKLQLFLTMMKIGIFTFGGGYAMIALLEDELVQKKKWIKDEDFLDMIAISESTPGPLAINCATYIGYNIGRVSGALVSTFGVVLPSFLIIYLISMVFDQFLEIRIIAHAFRGIQVCVIYLIASAGFSMWKSMKRNLFSITIFLLVFVVMIVLSITAVNISSILYIILGGLLGFISYLIRRRKGDEQL